MLDLLKGKGGKGKERVLFIYYSHESHVDITSQIQLRGETRRVSREEGGSLTV
jgi:hypothetical protein